MPSDSDLPTLPEFPSSLEPHELLEILVGELRTPLNSIAGWARVLSQDSNLEAISLDAADAIEQIAAYAAALLANASDYLDRRKT